MKKIYEIPELEITKFEVERKLMAGEPASQEGPGNTITNPHTESDPTGDPGDLPW